MYPAPSATALQEAKAKLKSVPNDQDSFLHHVWQDQDVQDLRGEIQKKTPDAPGQLKNLIYNMITDGPFKDPDTSARTQEFLDQLSSAGSNQLNVTLQGDETVPAEVEKLHAGHNQGAKPDLYGGSAWTDLGKGTTGLQQLSVAAKGDATSSDYAGTAFLHFSTDTHGAAPTRERIYVNVKPEYAPAFMKYMTQEVLPAVPELTSLKVGGPADQRADRIVMYLSSAQGRDRVLARIAEYQKACDYQFNINMPYLMDKPQVPVGGGTVTLRGVGTGPEPAAQRVSLSTQRREAVFEALCKARDEADFKARARTALAQLH